MVKTYIGLLRVSIGFIFLWAFFDKLLGLGYATSPDRSWLAGSSPTFGYLKNATHGPLAEFFQSLAGNPIVDFLFMAGLLGVGVAFVLGIALRFSSYVGSLMLALMYLSAFPPANNPVIDDHIIYALVLLVLANIDSKKNNAISSWWSKTSIAKTFPFLR